MRFITIIALVLLVTSCAAPHNSAQHDWERRLSKVNVGDDATALLNSLEAGRYPVRWIPGGPTEFRHVAYFLQGGEIHVITKTTATGISAIAERPYFVATDASVDQRLQQADREWDEYVKMHSSR